MDNKNVYIPSIDAKDLFISNNLIHPNKNGYNIRCKNGDMNLHKFINTLDYSLDLIKLREIYEKVYRRLDFSFKNNRKQYTHHVINVTFTYSNKLYNRIHGNVYVKFGYSIDDLVLVDNICIIDNNVIAIRVDDPVKDPVAVEMLGKYFNINETTFKTKTGTQELKKVYVAKSNIPTLHSRSVLRQNLYKEGFYCDGVHYIRFKRTSGSSRVGKCLFINELLYKRMHKWELCGLNIKEGQKTDLAALESYISLPTSSIIGTLEINPDNILIIDDYTSNFNDVVIATKIKGVWLDSQQQEVSIGNSIWDGQSLIDPDILGEYKEHGMVLLRNRFFKSCCFNTNIQNWFQDHNITDVSQLNGFTLAKNITDIKLITTPNSIKYLKFGTMIQWLEALEPQFGVVKHDKPTHFLGGRLVQTHYQLINTLQLEREDVEQLLKPTFDFLRLLRTEPSVVRYYLQYPADKEFVVNSITTKNDIVFHLMGINEKFSTTKLYQEFISDLVKSFIKNLKCGHVLVNGNYSTLFGNPIEMLEQTIGIFTGKSQIGKGNIHCKRFNYNQTILGSRSPHVTMGNVWLPNNCENFLVDKYFNLSNEIVCINSINENTLQRLSGADFDSDTVLLTDNQILIQAAKRNYQYFKVPTSQVEANKTSRVYTAEQKADLDIKTSVNKIGEIINLAQILNSLYWDNIAHGQTHEQNHDLYCDIATLDVMSGIEIDKAKKEFIVDNTKELNKLREKYKNRLTDDITGKDIKPHFFAHISKIKGYYDPHRKSYTKHKTSMDYLQTVVNSYRIKTVYKKVYSPFSTLLSTEGYNPSYIKYDQIVRVIELIRSMDTQNRAIWSRDYLDSSTKYDLISHLQQDCTDYINNFRFSYSTMYRLLLTIEEEKYSDVSKFLFSTLFGTPNMMFFQVIKQSQEFLPYIEENIRGNIEIFSLLYEKFTE